MSARDSDPVDAAIEQIHRSERARVLARLIGLLRDFDLAEEALQDAFVAAVESWPRSGIPTNPAGWLMTVARRKAIDRIRSVAARDRRQREWGELSVAWTPGDPEETIADDRLRLVFTCCHPALATDAQVALTLRTLGGLSTADVARAFMVSEATLAQRLVRAKRKIRNSRVPYQVPDPVELPARLDSVLAVVYLIFNAGYLPGEGDSLLRVDLCDEAKRLATLLVDLLPGEPEPSGLAALLYLHDARRAARIGGDGRPVTLEEQDRELWDRRQILTGLQLLGRTTEYGPPGPYVLKACIAAVHASTRDPSETDWRAIVGFYDQLVRFEPTPIVALNRAVAVAMADSPETGLALLDDRHLRDALAEYHLYHSTRADLLRRSGLITEAAEAYEQARRLTHNRAEHEFFDRRLGELFLDDL
jgi:RNA polymerase sigma-70 factor (ECF subfamily)